MNKDQLLVREEGLQRSLTQKQLTMIGLGGAIGTGLFMGSGIAIGYAGPGVILSYLIAAFIAVIMILSLSEMAVAHPTAGSFGTYAEKYISPLVGYIARYTYWAAQVIAVGSEAVAVGIYMTYWFPGSPIWLWTLGFGAILIYSNCRSVANFGSIEYWFAMIKVIAIVVFILIGITLLLGITAPSPGFTNFTAHDGFIPNGFSGVWMAVLIAIFSFYGVELIAVTAGEAKDPHIAVPKAMRTMVLRLFLFYICSLGIMLAAIPWTEVGAKSIDGSPFVKLFESVGFTYAAGVMNFVVLTAALSSMNANLYLTGRMMFSLSRGNYAPSKMGQLSANGTPVNALIVSSVGIAIAALTAKFSPLAFNYLFGIALFGGIIVWMIILASHLKFRKAWEAQGGEKLPVRSPFYPYLQIIGLLLLAAILITMAFDTDFWNIAWIVGVPWIIFLSITYFIWGRKSVKQSTEVNL